MVSQYLKDPKLKIENRKNFVIELSKQAYINIQNQKVFLEETEVNKEVKIPIYEKDGKISTKIRLWYYFYNDGRMATNTTNEK